MLHENNIVGQLSNFNDLTNKYNVKGNEKNVSYLHVALTQAQCSDSNKMAANHITSTPITLDGRGGTGGDSRMCGLDVLQRPDALEVGLEKGARSMPT